MAMTIVGGIDATERATSSRPRRGENGRWTGSRPVRETTIGLLYVATAAALLDTTMGCAISAGRAR